MRLSESDLTRLVRRVMQEQTTGGDIPFRSGGMPPNTKLFECNQKMDQAKNVGGSMELSGPIDRISYNGTVAPQYQGYTVYKGGKPFCLITKR